MNEVVSGARRARFPAAAFRAPALAALDARGRDELEAAGCLVRRRAGQAVYRAGEPADAFYVVVEGAVRMEALRRGEDRADVARRVERGESFGEEATLLGVARHAAAVAELDTLLVEVPMALYARAAARAGAGAALERALRGLRRSAAQRLLCQLVPELEERDVELLLDAATASHWERGARLLSAGDPAHSALLVIDGLVQLQTERDARAHVIAYLKAGDLCGDQACLRGEPHAATAVALAPCHALSLPAELLRQLARRRPGLVARLGRVAADRAGAQQAAAAGVHATQHVLRDVYRMHTARALLAIDAESCVRCGHCAWACAELYGVSRLIRRGERVVAQLARDGDHASPRALLLPSSCQHCRNPLCMVDCPTGAIARDPGGDVFIREELCTGCGACAKACPWDNVRMAPLDAGRLVAVKCDLCRDYQEPACVQACPTDAIQRLEPMRDLLDVQRLFAGSKEPASVPHARTARPARLAGTLALSLSLALGVLAWRLHASGAVDAGQGPGFWAGIMAGLGCVALALHSVPKRAVRWRMKCHDQGGGAARPRLAALVVVHGALGALTVLAVLLHSGLRLPANGGGAVALAFWLTALLGAAGAFAYRVVPRTLARLERRATLPEDLTHERQALLERLEARLSGRDALVKAICQRIVLPHATRWWGGVVLVLSGRSLHDEERVLRARIDALLGGRGAQRLDGLDDVVRLAVELRALPARRALEALLRGWVPLHALLAALLLALLGVHVIGVVGP
jgi:Fe-S-cluster-containing dehydrogenase component